MHVEDLILKAWKDWNEENVYSYEFHNLNNSIIASVSDEEYILIDSRSYLREKNLAGVFTGRVYDFKTSNRILGTVCTVFLNAYLGLKDEDIEFLDGKIDRMIILALSKAGEPLKIKVDVEDNINIVGLSKYKKFEYTVETTDYHHIFNLLTRRFY